VSHGFTLIVTDDTTCPGVTWDKLGGRPDSLGTALWSITAVRHWITFEKREGEQVYVLGDKDPIPRHLAARSLTFPVDDAFYRRYEEARATA
jgi:hypothetical protein